LTPSLPHEGLRLHLCRCVFCFFVRYVRLRSSRRKRWSARAWRKWRAATWRAIARSGSGRRLGMPLLNHPSVLVLDDRSTVSIPWPALNRSRLFEAIAKSRGMHVIISAIFWEESIASRRTASVLMISATFCEGQIKEFAAKFRDHPGRSGGLVPMQRSWRRLRFELDTSLKPIFGMMAKASWYQHANAELFYLLLNKIFPAVSSKSTVCSRRKPKKKQKKKKKKFVRPTPLSIPQSDRMVDRMTLKTWSHGTQSGRRNSLGGSMDADLHPCLRASPEPFYAPQIWIIARFDSAASSSSHTSSAQNQPAGPAQLETQHTIRAGIVRSTFSRLVIFFLVHGVFTWLFPARWSNATLQ